MSNTYVEKYDVGQIKLDLPYANYIHELPLLSFGDVQHTINLSLVFNYARKYNGDCSFYIDEGLKLNLQKRIGFDACAGTPLEFIESNGKCISLTKSSDIYTFKDESQRILRITGTTYELEYPDFSKETYNSDGYITAAYDKYGTEVLTYTYDDDRLINISYRGSKNIELGYNSSDQLTTITCAGCAINFYYNNDRSLNFFRHYSGVYYTFDFANRYKVFVGDGVGSGAKTVTVNTDTTNKTITVSNQNNDSVMYKFCDSIISTTRNRIVDITNNLGVKTRLQYDNYGKLLYSYEANETDSDGNDTMFVNGRYTGNVCVYRNGNKLNTANYTTYMLNEEVERVWCANVSDHVNQGGCYILTGWIQSGDYDTSTIRISETNTDMQINCVVGQWVYFATKFANEYENISIATGIVDENENYYEVKDLRITYIPSGDANTGVYDDLDKEEGFIVCNGSTVALSSASMYYKSGNSYISVSGVTATDAIKYKLNKIKDRNTTEVYYNKCKGVIKGTSGLFVLHSGQYYDVANLEIRKKITSGDKEYVTAIGYDNSNILVESFINNVSTGVQKLNMNLDVTETVSDGIKVTYEYESDSCGLISKLTTEPTTGAVDSNTIVRQYNYDTDLTKLESYMDEFGNTTEYTTDDTWGVVTAVTLPDGSVIADTYDGDMGVLTQKSFDSADTRKNVFGYSNGNLTSITSGALSYDFGYTTKDELASVIKNDAGVEHHTYTESDGETTVVSKYPSSTSALHTETKVFDKYGRLKGVEGVLSNVYDASPVFNSTTGALIPSADNGSSRLAMSTDLLTDETRRYMYNGSGAIAEATVTDSDNFSNKVSTEVFEYDTLGRLTKDDYTYDPTTENSVTSDFEYATEEDNPLADNRVSSYSFKVDGTEKAKTENSFDNLKRITNKKYTVGGKEFNKTITYDKTRIQRLRCLCGTKNVGNNNYSYDQMGRIYSDTYTSDYSDGDYKTYKYDSYGQLIRENSQALDKTFIYEYNNIGNIVKVKEYDFTISTTPSGDYTEKTYTYDTACPDRLINFNGNSISYNSMGCPTSYGNKSYEWKNGKLARVYRGSAEQAGSLYEDCIFKYNARGQRVSKTVIYDINPATTSDYSYRHDTTYDYDNSGRLIRQYTTQATTYEGGGINVRREFIFLYDESGIIGVLYSYNNTTLTPYYFHRNIQGDVVAIYDTNGNKVVEYAYDAWGNCKVVSATNSDLASTNPIRYRGYCYDKEIGWYYLNARYYSPEWRRFISPDDTAFLDSENVNGLNLYCYCANDPVNYADPSGHEAKTWLSIIGTVADYLITIASAGVGAYLGFMTGGGVPAMLAGALVTTMAVNNLVNLVYYWFIPSDPNNEIKIYEDSQVGLGSDSKSYYAENGYINRWDRLRYIKSKNGGNIFNYDAWFDYAEYSIHMELWLRSKWAYETNIPLFNEIAEHSIHTLFGHNPFYVDLAIILWGYLGV